MKLNEMTAHALKEVMDKKEVSALDIAQAHFDHIDKTQTSINALVTSNKDQAFEAARDVDRRRQTGEKLAPLAGIPMGLKDNISTKGLATTCSSKMLENYLPSYDAYVVERLSEAGSVLVGKLNLDEFAMGSSTETSYFGPTKNPWDTSRVPGGSSGGPAAAVAARQAVYALGTDTGGSVRHPASLCGLVGLKPSYGRVSRYGLLAFASSLDQVGTFSRDVEDAALILQAISGYDKRDSTSANRPVPDYSRALGQDVKGLKIGLPKEYFGEGMDPATVDRVRQAARTLESLGAQVEECSLPHTKYALAVYYIIAPAECSSNMARFDGVRYGYRNMEADHVLEMYLSSRSEGLGHEVKKRIMLGTYALSAGKYDDYYLKAQKVRRLIKEDFDQAFKSYDLLLTPTSMGPAFKLGAKADDPMSLYQSDLCTVAVNMAGLPAMSVPCGLVEGLPVGLQMVAPAFMEMRLLQLGHAFQKATDFHLLKPELEV